jgi:hypothetical protein
MYKIVLKQVSITTYCDNFYRMLSQCCLCVCVSTHINVSMPESVFMKLGMYYHGTWTHLSWVLHKFLPQVCVSMCISPILLSEISVKSIPPVVARQRLDKHNFAATHTDATTGELLKASISVRSMLYQRNVGVSYSTTSFFRVTSRRKSSSGIWCRVVMVRTDVSEERIASIFRAGESRREYSEQVAATTTTRHQIPEEDLLHRHRLQNLKSYRLQLVRFENEY